MRGGLKRIRLFKLIFLSSRLKKKHKVVRFGLWPRANSSCFDGECLYRFIRPLAALTVLTLVE